jgi:hypothetical protein
MSKKLLGASFILAALSLLSLTVMAKDKALLIGIDHYQISEFDIDGCENDTQLLREFLISKLGFKADDIKILVNKQATEANIRSSVESWLIEGTGPGDRVFFAYSGHGTRVPDVSGDETLDGMDEALAVYDVTPEQPYVKGSPVIPVSGYLLDDEISQWIANLYGRQVVMLFDSCHSGTISRAMDNSSGIDSRFLRFRDDKDQRDKKDVYSPDYNKSPKSRDVDTVTEGFLDKVINGVVVISAAGADQEAFPIFASKYGRKQGALTFLFVEEQLGGLIPIENLQNALSSGMEELKRSRLLSKGRNGEYQSPQVEIYSQQAGLPIFGAAPSFSWLAAPEIALHNPLSETKVGIWTADNRRDYSITKPNKAGPGETIPLVVSTSDPGYLYIWVFSKDNEAKCLFPSRFDKQNFVKAGTYTFPRCAEGKEKCGEEEKYEYYASAPEGRDVWVALVTDQPLELRADGYEYTWAEAFKRIGLEKVQAALSEYVKNATSRGGDVRLMQKPTVKAWQAGAIVLGAHR